MIDMHTHILPGIDDGSKSVEMSLGMLEKMRKQGTTLICATSHYYHHEISIEGYIERRNNAYKLLSNSRTNDIPKILLSAEVAYFNGIAECKNIHDLCIEGTNTLMLEMPFTEWTNLQIEDVQTLALDRNLKVVLVHPERFCFSKNNKEMLEKLVELPIALQVNSESLIKWRTRKQALSLLEMTDTPLLGSDCHNLDKRPVNLLEGRNIVKRKLGANFLETIDANSRLLTMTDKDD